MNKNKFRDRSHNPVAKHITLRDYFAGQVIIGLLASVDQDLTISERQDMFATHAYEVADKMLWKRQESLEK